jgi:transposase
VRFILSPGQQNDMAPAYDLVEGLNARQWLADRAYDADGLCALICEQGGEAVIPPRTRRKIKR